MIAARWRIGLPVVMLAAALTMAPQASYAAGGDLTVSTDGVTFVESSSGPVFTGIDKLVPGDSDTSTLYVRNTGEDAGYLRIVIGDVSFTDLDYANALTVSASINGAAGPAIPFSLADPCWVLLEGTVLNPGQTVSIDAELALANLDGTRGQGAVATASLIASLSDATVGSIAPTECGRTNVSVPITPSPNRPQNGAIVNSGDPSSDGSAGLVADESTDLPVLNIPELLGIDPNTWRLFEELFVFVLFGAMLVGGFWFWLVHRRRGRASAQIDDNGGAP